MPVVPGQSLHISGNPPKKANYAFPGGPTCACRGGQGACAFLIGGEACEKGTDCCKNRKQFADKYEWRTLY